MPPIHVSQKNCFKCFNCNSKPFFLKAALQLWLENWITVRLEQSNGPTPCLYSVFYTFYTSIHESLCTRILKVSLRRNFNSKIIVKTLQALQTNFHYLGWSRKVPQNATSMTIQSFSNNCKPINGFCSCKEILSRIRFLSVYRGNTKTENSNNKSLLVDNAWTFLPTGIHKSNKRV